jgi:hypothetical protein
MDQRDAAGLEHHPESSLDADLRDEAGDRSARRDEPAAAWAGARRASHSGARRVLKPENLRFATVAARCAAQDSTAWARGGPTKPGQAEERRKEWAGQQAARDGLVRDSKKAAVWVRRRAEPVAASPEDADLPAGEWVNHGPARAGAEASRAASGCLRSFPLQLEARRPLRAQVSPRQRASALDRQRASAEVPLHAPPYRHREAAAGLSADGAQHFRAWPRVPAWPRDGQALSGLPPIHVPARERHCRCAARRKGGGHATHHCSIGAADRLYLRRSSSNGLLFRRCQVRAACR